MKSNRPRVSRRVLLAGSVVAAGLLLPAYVATADHPLGGKVELNRTGRAVVFVFLAGVELAALLPLWLAWLAVAWVAGRGGRGR